MADHYWPTLLEPASTRLEIQDSAGRFSSPTTGYTRTISRPGERMRLSLNFQNLNAERRAALQSLIARLQGATHRVWAHDHSNRIRGSFPSAELLTNNTFADGTAGWTTNRSTISVADRVLRMEASQATGSVEVFRSVALTQYAPHVLRSIILDGRGTSGLSIGVAINSGGVAATSYSTARGLHQAVLVAPSASAASQYPGVIAASFGYLAGDFIEIPWCSLSRCALVDNGPNALLQSETLFNAAWTQVGLTAPTANNTDVAPDGTTTAETMTENTANSGHYVAQSSVTISSAAADYAFSVSLKARSASFAFISMQENPGNHECYVSINLSTGALGTPTATGANWTNPRAFVVNQGNGWYRLTIVGRKTSAAVAMTAVIYIADSLTLTSYTGSSRSIAAWGASLAQSSVPVRYVATTTTAVASGTSQSPAGPLHSKGWPASTNGLLLPGDQYQIGNQLHIVVAPVNSDAAGLAVIEGYPARRSAPADNAPVVINQPLGRFFLEPDVNGWSNKPGIFSDAEIVLAEAS